jgi:hypothetical protein
MRRRFCSSLCARYRGNASDLPDCWRVIARNASTQRSQMNVSCGPEVVNLRSCTYTVLTGIRARRGCSPHGRGNRRALFLFELCTGLFEAISQLTVAHPVMQSSLSSPSVNSVAVAMAWPWQTGYLASEIVAQSLAEGAVSSGHSVPRRMRDSFARETHRCGRRERSDRADTNPGARARETWDIERVLAPRAAGRAGD